MGVPSASIGVHKNLSEAEMPLVQDCYEGNDWPHDEAHEKTNEGMSGVDSVTIEPDHFKHFVGSCSSVPGGSGDRGDGSGGLGMADLANRVIIPTGVHVQGVRVCARVRVRVCVRV